MVLAAMKQDAAQGEDEGQMVALSLEMTYELTEKSRDAVVTGTWCG